MDTLILTMICLAMLIAIYPLNEWRKRRDEEARREQEEKRSAPEEAPKEKDQA